MADGMGRPRGRYRLGFVVEQVLGHRTHYKNLRRFVAEDERVEPQWLPVEFAPSDTVSRLPGVRSNWSARASWLAYKGVRAWRREGPLDAAFYHTQVTSLLSPYQGDLPTVVSLDATPINYDSVGEFYGHASGGRLERLKFSANRRSFAHARALITWCAWAKRSLADDYGVAPEKVTVIAPGVDLSQWPNVAGAERAAASAGRLPRLLFVGGEFERKGGATLLDVFLGGLQDSCELHVVTQSPLEERRNLHVYSGVTPNSETLLRLYRESDIFVFPSLADCAPLAVPEAMAASLPVVTTDVGAIPEMVQDGRNGFVTRPGDAPALAQALRALLADAGLRARMGDAGRAIVERDYDAARNARRLVDVVIAAAEGRREEARSLALRQR